MKVIKLIFVISVISFYTSCTLENINEDKPKIVKVKATGGQGDDTGSPEDGDCDGNDDCDENGLN